MTVKTVQDASLTSVANAIRAKGGTSAQLTFPADFVTAIENISGGGGGGSPIASITVETAVATTPDMVALLTENVSEWELNQFYFVSIEGNTATGQYKGLSCSVIRHNGGLQYCFLRPANMTTTVSDTWRFDISVGATVDIYKIQNAIYPDPLQRIIIRPDAELVQTWSYDGLIVEDEGVTIPAYSTAQQILMASSRIAEVTLDDSNYKYFVVARTISIPIYNTAVINAGRFEWSGTTHIYEDVVVKGADWKSLIDGTATTSDNMSFSGGNYYRGVFYNSQVKPTVATSNTYGAWQSFGAPGFGSGKLRINRPSFIIRGTSPYLSQEYWEAITDIRYQYVIELWRAPIGSLSYDGWQWSQSFDHILDCVYSNDHKLT